LLTIKKYRKLFLFALDIFKLRLINAEPGKTNRLINLIILDH